MFCVDLVCVGSGCFGLLFVGLLAFLTCLCFVCLRCVLLFGLRWVILFGCGFICYVLVCVVLRCSDSCWFVLCCLWACFGLNCFGIAYVGVFCFVGFSLLVLVWFTFNVCVFRM